MNWRGSQLELQFRGRRRERSQAKHSRCTLELMPLIITPGQLKQRAEFYHQLGQLTGAGLGLLRALEQLKRSPPARSYREPIQRLLDQLADGYTLNESLQRVSHW